MIQFDAKFGRCTDTRKYILRGAIAGLLIELYQGYEYRFLAKLRAKDRVKYKLLNTYHRSYN